MIAGVWVDGTRKIAAIGVAVSHSVSYHGIAINANVDLKWFDHVGARQYLQTLNNDKKGEVFDMNIFSHFSN